MTYAIHNWRDGSKYPSDPIAAAPPAFIEIRKKNNYSDEQIRTVFWHWEFLRRHPLYQRHWASDGVEYFSMFGVCGTFRPDPKVSCPPDLLFRYELFGQDSRSPTIIDLRKSWKENETRLKQQYDSLVKSKSAFENFIISGFVPWPKAGGDRKSRVSEGQFSELLRVLDAHIEGVTFTQIARELRSNLKEGALYNTGKRLCGYALDIQADLTRLPHMHEPDT